MPRTVKCGLIQCSNAAPTDLPIEEIKRLNIEKHLRFIEQAAAAGRADHLHAGSFHDAVLLRRAADALVRSGGTNSRWSNRAADAGSRQGAWHGDHRADL